MTTFIAACFATAALFVEGNGCCLSRSCRGSRRGDISANAQGARCPTDVAAGFRAAVADTQRLSMRLSYDDYLIDTIDVNPGARMDTVTISPKFPVVIPQAVREALKLRPHRHIHRYDTVSLVALGEELGTDLVFTLDRRGFSAYRLNQRKSFKLVP